MKIKKSELISTYAQSVGVEAANELITQKINAAAVEDKEDYTEEEIARICGELTSESGLIRIVAQTFLVELERNKLEEKTLLLDNIDTQIWYLTDVETYGAVNKARAEFLGMEKRDLEGRNIYDIATGEECQDFIVGNREVFKKKKQIHTEQWVKNGKGEERLLSITKTPKIDDNGNAEYLICAAEDITERKRAEEEKSKLAAQLQQAQKMEAIGTLAAGIAHDFNNILSAIIGYTELASDNIAGGTNADAKANLEEVLKACRRARDLVRLILAFSRQRKKEPVPLQIHLIVKEALKLVRSFVPTTIEIRQSITTFGRVMADPTQMHQVIMNLCTNAYQAMQEDGGILEVNLSEIDIDLQFASHHPGLNPGPYIRLTVGDTGCGMDKSVIDRVFDPYFTTKEMGDEGTGLGLSVVHGIVKEHGGAITVYSEPGEGTIFNVYLPRTEQVEETAKGEAEKPLPTGHEHILFIDDDPAIADLTKQMLERLGYEVVTRTSGIEALELFRAKPDDFDLVITDMTMPNMTGDTLGKELMRIRPDIPVILFTGYSERISEEKARAIGIREFAMKPLAMWQLADIIRKVLDGGDLLRIGDVID
jgi:PAS domain S-box-containing protein